MTEATLPVINAVSQTVWTFQFTVSEETLPAINAILNGIATVLLVTGYLTIRRDRQRITPHAYIMGSAFLVSAVFLASYILHKSLYGDRGVPEEIGWVRWIYWFVLLIPHVILAIVMLPMIFATLLRAYWRQWEKHRRIARPTFWIWLYVSVTGVIIYALLYHVWA